MLEHSFKLSTQTGHSAREFLMNTCEKNSQLCFYTATLFQNREGKVNHYLISSERSLLCSNFIICKQYNLIISTVSSWLKAEAQITFRTIGNQFEKSHSPARGAVSHIISVSDHLPFMQCNFLSLSNISCHIFYVIRIQNLSMLILDYFTCCQSLKQFLFFLQTVFDTAINRF